MKIAKRKPQGHYCKICGQSKSNESFSGKGHTAHICKVCSRLTPAEKSEEMMLNRLMSLPMRRLTDAEKKWLENRTHDKREAVRAAAREVYNLHFPHAERNAMKKQLRINEVIFTVNTELWDEYGDEIPVSRKFWFDRKIQAIHMQELNDSSEPITVELQPPVLAKLLKWMLHSLEVFCWDEDYCSRPSCDSFDDGIDFDEPDAFDELDEECENDNEPAKYEENTDKGEPTWSVWLKYSDGHEQNIISHEDGLPDRVDELYWALADYFPQDEPEYDFIENAFACRDLVSIGNLVAELIRTEAQTGDDEQLALAWLDLVMLRKSTQQEDLSKKRTYHIHSGAMASIYFLLSYVNTLQPDQINIVQTGKQRLKNFANYVSANIVAPIGDLISVSEIDMVMNALGKKYKLINRLFQNKKLVILRLENTHITFNSICNAMHSPNNPSHFDYELFLFHTKGKGVGHPVYILLHELGHILQTEITHDPETAPDDFVKLINQMNGEKLQQGSAAVELFADSFAIAMMQTFDWAKYDPFKSIDPIAKEIVRLYMDGLITQTVF